MRVSILIPVYNSEKFLRETIKSALDQTWPDKEIVVVDDGSTDGSVAIARSFESDMVKVFTQAKAGACRARNKAFEESTGDYIQYLDADDLLSPDKIEIQLNLLKDKKESVCNGRWGRFYSNEPLTEDIKWGPHERLQRDLTPVEWLCQNHMSATHCWLTPRELVLNAGKWDETLTQNQDGDFFTRVLAHAKMVYYTDEAKAYYRSGRNDSVSKKRTLNKNLQSRFNTCVSYEKVILKLEDSERTRLAVSNNYQQFIYSTFPDHIDLIKKAEEKVVDYGGSNWPLAKGGRWVSILTTLLGWKSVALLKKMIRIG